MPVNPSFGPRTLYPNFSKALNVNSGSASTTASTLVAGVTGWTIYVTAIRLSVTQDGATQLKVEDTTSSVILQTVSAPGLVEITREWGDEGLALTEGYGIQYKFTTASTAFACKGVIEGYLKQTSPVTAAAYAAAVFP